MPPRPPDPSDADALDRLRSAFEASGYTTEELRALFSEGAGEAHLEGWSNPARRRIEGKGPLGTLARLFALGLDVHADDLDAVPKADLADWVTTGVVSMHRKMARSNVLIEPVRITGPRMLLAADVPQGPRRSLFADFVPGTAGFSSQLAMMTPRRPFSRAIDIGTGQGIQAVLASEHCEQVVATDVNPRSLAFARFNLALNGIAKVDLRRGDRYDPVEGEQFNLIVSNPPVVVSPSSTVRFRDSGMPGDTISSTTTTGAADHLSPGGWAFVICQWVHVDGESWQDHVGAWVGGTGCDAWAVQLRAVDTVAHALEWLHELGKTDPSEADREFDRWMSYFDEQRIIGIGSGFVVLRKSEGDQGWYKADELDAEITVGADETIAGMFAAQDWLSAHPGAGDVLDASWRLAETASLFPGSGSNSPVLRQAAGLRHSVPITQDHAEIVSKCDGSWSLRSIFDEHWKGRGRVPSQWHEEDTETTFRQLAGAGFVVRAPESA